MAVATYHCKTIYHRNAAKKGLYQWWEFEIESNLVPHPKDRQVRGQYSFYFPTNHISAIFFFFYVCVLPPNESLHSSTPILPLVRVRVAASSILFVARDGPTSPEFDNKHALAPRRVIGQYFRVINSAHVSHMDIIRGNKAGFIYRMAHRPNNQANQADADTDHGFPVTSGAIRIRTFTAMFRAFTMTRYPFYT